MNDWCQAFGSTPTTTHESSSRLEMFISQIVFPLRSLRSLFEIQIMARSDVVGQHGLRPKKVWFAETAAETFMNAGKKGYIYNIIFI